MLEEKWKLYNSLEKELEDLTNFSNSVEIFSREWLINNIEIIRVQSEMLGISETFDAKETTTALKSAVKSKKERIFKIIRKFNR